MPDKQPDVPLAVNKGGRPPKLKPDEATLATVRGLGQIQATTRECAAFLDVSEPTFLKFKADNPEVADALENGQSTGRISLRRTQLRLAEHNAAMAIFLGKNLLGQSDKHEFENRVTYRYDLSGYSPDELDALERLVAKASISAGDTGGESPSPSGSVH